MGTKSFSLKLNYKIKPFKKNIKIDSDKSLSIRSFLIGAISQNISEVNNVLESEDVFSTINCLKKLGVKIRKVKKGSYLIFGKGLGSLYAKKNSLLNYSNNLKRQDFLHDTISLFVLKNYHLLYSLHLPLNYELKLIHRFYTKHQFHNRNSFLVL